MSRKDNRIDELRVMLNAMKSKFGITQTAIARVLGLSAQALTDIKGGRRAFTPSMAEKMLAEYASQPWSDWLSDRLKTIISPATQAMLPPSEPEMTVPAATVVYVVASGSLPRIPLLRAPFLGTHTAIEERCERYVQLPEWTVALIPPDSDPYILELATDDYSGRLRAGDHILVVQTVLPNKEIMLVEQSGGLRLAQNAVRSNAEITDSAGWIALDSGVMLKSAMPMATVIGVTMARM